MKYIDQLVLKGKRVLIRVDFNVPMNPNNGEVADLTRIEATLPTLLYALNAKARLILCSHLGSPKGVRSEALSLRPVVPHLSRLLERRVEFSEDCIGPKVEEQVEKLAEGEVLLLENLRFHEGEEKNDKQFSEALARLADVYINDAFATAHRAHASIVGVAALMPEKAGGFTLKRELEYFNRAFENPARPFVVVFGGAKVSTKMNAIRNVGQRADAIIIGGAMANTFLVAQGYEVGKSLYEPEQVAQARRIQAELVKRGCAFHLPLDLVVAPELKVGAPKRVVGVDKIPADMMALDIGPETAQCFAQVLKPAKTVIWNGPMGAFETEGFEAGSFALIDALSSLSALTVVGGGDTDLALHKRRAFHKMSYVSTAGGAFLKLLEGAALPALTALE